MWNFNHALFNMQVKIFASVFCQAKAEDKVKRS